MTDYMVDIRGKSYLTVVGRIVMFREKYPTGRIDTEVLAHNENGAMFKATVYDNTGNFLASGHGSETKADWNDYREKAETKAVGRALAMAGFGTAQALQDFDEGERIVDAPISTDKKIVNQVKQTNALYKGNTAGASEKQIWAIKKMAQDVGVDLEEFTQATFGKKYIDLTVEEASSIIGGNSIDKFAFDKKEDVTLEDIEGINLAYEMGQN